MQYDTFPRDGLTSSDIVEQSEGSVLGSGRKLAEEQRTPVAAGL